MFANKNTVRTYQQEYPGSCRLVDRIISPTANLFAPLPTPHPQPPNRAELFRCYCAASMDFCGLRPDMTGMVGWAFTISYLSIRFGPF